MKKLFKVVLVTENLKHHLIWLVIFLIGFPILYLIKIDTFLAWLMALMIIMGASTVYHLGKMEKNDA